VQRDQDVDVILGVISADDDGAGLEDEVRCIDGGFLDRDVGGGVGSEVENERRGDTEYDQGDEDGGGEVATFGLGEL
jgi:hypothetical protein